MWLYKLHELRVLIHGRVQQKGSEKEKQELLIIEKELQMCKQRCCLINITQNDLSRLTVAQLQTKYWPTYEAFLSVYEKINTLMWSLGMMWPEQQQQGDDFEIEDNFLEEAVE